MAATESSSTSSSKEEAASSSSSSSTVKRKIDDISNGNSEGDNVNPTTTRATTVAAASGVADVTNGDLPMEAGAVSLETPNAEATGGARPKIRRPEAMSGPTAMLENGAGLYHEQIAPQVSLAIFMILVMMM